MFVGALSYTEWQQPHVFLRSLWRRDRRIFIADADRRRHRRDETWVLRLVCHLAITSLVFLALTTLVLIVSWTFHFMHSVYPFPDDVFRLLDRVEILLIYADVAVSGIVLLYGLWRYIVKVIRGN